MCWRKVIGGFCKRNEIGGLCRNEVVGVSFGWEMLRYWRKVLRRWKMMKCQRKVVGGICERVGGSFAWEMVKEMIGGGLEGMVDFLCDTHVKMIMYSYTIGVCTAHACIP